MAEPQRTADMAVIPGAPAASAASADHARADPALPAPAITVTIRYYAAARAAAGVAEEQLTVPAVPAIAVDSAEPGGAHEAARGCEVATVLAIAAEQHGPELGRVLLRCSFLLDEVAVHGTATTVRDGQVLDVLPPFAGG